MLSKFHADNTFHVRIQEFIKVLIVATSLLDAVVGSIRKCIVSNGKSMMCYIQTYAVAVEYVLILQTKDDKIPHIVVFVGSESHLRTGCELQ